MNTDLLVFNLDQQRFALPVKQILRVVPRARLTALPGAPAGLIGMLRLHGELLPVVDLRPSLRLPTTEPRIGDCIVVVRTSAASFGLLAESVDGVVSAHSGGMTRGLLEVSGHVVTVIRADDLVDGELRAYLAA